LKLATCQFVRVHYALLSVSSTVEVRTVCSYHFAIYSLSTRFVFRNAKMQPDDMVLSAKM